MNCKELEELTKKHKEAKKKRWKEEYKHERLNSLRVHYAYRIFELCEDGIIEKPRGFLFYSRCPTCNKRLEFKFEVTKGYSQYGKWGRMMLYGCQGCGYVWVKGKMKKGDLED